MKVSYWRRGSASPGLRLAQTAGIATDVNTQILCSETSVAVACLRDTTE